MGRKSRALTWPCAVLISIKHPSEDVKEAAGSMCLQLSRKVMARAINLGVISV